MMRRRHGQAQTILNAIETKPMIEESKNIKREMMIPVSGPDDPETTCESKELIEEGRSEDLSAKYLDQLQRLQAEFSNYRKRIDNERISLFSLAKRETILKLLPVLDDFERMVNLQNGDCRVNLDGVNFIYQNFKKILTEEGLEEIASVGEKFDPGVHEAVDVEQTEADKDGIVVEEWQKGYRFGGRMLRPSKVKVGRCGV